MTKIEPSIFKKEKKNLHVRYTKKYKGKRREWKRSNVSSLREARIIKEQFVVEASRWVEEQKSGFGSWGTAKESYIKEARKIKTYATVETEQHNLNKYTAEWDNLALSSLSTKFVRSQVETALAPTKEVTRKSVVKHIRNVFSYLISEGAINTNPLAGFTMWSKKSTRKELSCLTREQTVKLFKEAYKRNHPFKDIWHVTYGMGLRSGEAMGLQWSDIDWDKGTAFIQRAAIKCNRANMGLPKGGKSRHVAIYPQLLQRLKDMKDREMSGTMWVLPYLPEWRNQKAAYVLKCFLRELKLPEVRFHDLRAAFITQLLESGNVGLSTVKALVGHERTETTDRYVRNSAVQIIGKTKAIELEGVLDNPKARFDWDSLEESVSFMDELNSI